MRFQDPTALGDSPSNPSTQVKEWEIMRKGSMTIVLLALLLASSALATQIEKPIINEQIPQKSVSMGHLGFRTTLVSESFEVAVPPAGCTRQTAIPPPPPWQ